MRWKKLADYGITVLLESFAWRNFAPCFHEQKFRVSVYIEPMVPFITWAKFYCIEDFYNARVAGLGKIFV